MSLFNYLKNIAIRNKSTLRTKTFDGNSASAIIGYYNQPPIKYKAYFIGSRYICRQCRTLLNDDMLNLATKMSELYKELDPIEYQYQLDEYNKIDNRFKIPNSIFTTITINYNLQCKPHTDKGNYRQKSIILVLGKFNGCSLIIDDIEYKLENNDFMIIDGSKIHYNTPLIDGERISLVFYIRDGMSNCHQEKWVKNKLFLL